MPDEIQGDGPGPPRWRVLLTFFLIVGISGGAFAIALFDRGIGEAGPPAPPAVSVPAERTP